MLILLISLACKDRPSRLPGDGCRMSDHGRYVEDDPDCPCSDKIYNMTDYSSATCRPDQELEIVWPIEVQPAARFEDEDQEIKALVHCKCKVSP